MPPEQIETRLAIGREGERGHVDAGVAALLELAVHAAPLAQCASLAPMLCMSPTRRHTSPPLGPPIPLILKSTWEFLFCRLIKEFEEKPSQRGLKRVRSSSSTRLAHRLPWEAGGD